MHVETLFPGGSILFDLGDIAALPARKVLHVDHIFVSHTHVDHFIGFDRLLRLLIGREMVVHLYGPAGFIDRVHHKLRAYEWNLAAGYEAELVFDVSEFASPEELRSAEFRLRSAFDRRDLGTRPIADGVLLETSAFRVRTTALTHRDTTSLAFAIEEPVHVNVWKTRLDALGLPVGQWLRDLKQAVVEKRPDDTPIVAGPPGSPTRPLGDLRDLVTLTPGQKIAYVTDVADTSDNRERIVDLARGADILFIEAVFAADDRELSRQRGHLSTTAAGEIARAAGVGRVEPFHFSPRYSGEDQRLLDEVERAFRGAMAVHGRRPSPAVEFSTG